MTDQRCSEHACVCASVHQVHAPNSHFFIKRCQFQNLAGIPTPVAFGTPRWLDQPAWPGRRPKFSFMNFPIPPQKFPSFFFKTPFSHIYRGEHAKNWNHPKTLMMFTHQQVASALLVSPEPWAQCEHKSNLQAPADEWHQQTEQQHTEPRGTSPVVDHHLSYCGQLQRLLQDQRWCRHSLEKQDYVTTTSHLT